MLRETPRHDLRHAVGAHRHAVEDIGGLHRPLLVGDDDELRAVGVAPEQLDEARDVRVVERSLDLVEQVEGAGPREEEGEQERDRAQRLLAAGKQREARDALARGPQLDLDPSLPVLALGLDQAQAALAPREERGGDLLEVLRDGVERLGEAALDGLRELGSQPLELLEAPLEVLALSCEV